jgi:hypothetical protein
MVVDFTAVATEVGTADTASNLSVISYKFYVVSSTYKGTDAVRLGLGPEVFSGLKPLPFAAYNLGPKTCNFLDRTIMNPRKYRIRPVPQTKPGPLILIG